MTNRVTGLIAFATVGLCLAGCKILPTPSGDAAEAGAFNPEAMAEELWTPRVLPYLRDKAGPLAEVQAAAKSDPAAAGATYGNPKKQASSPWTYAASVEGKIVAANTKSRAATIDIDIDGDGAADARAQIGPAMRGTALRDSLDFINFNDFTNQIDFAQLGKALNTHADRTVLSTLPREDLEGRTVTLLGAYSANSGAELPLLTPAEAAIGPKP